MLQIIDFGISIFLSRDAPKIKNPNVLEGVRSQSAHSLLSVSPVSRAGTLAYMAPEQTGRMNRSLDWRADL